MLDVGSFVVYLSGWGFIDTTTKTGQVNWLIPSTQQKGASCSTTCYAGQWHTRYLWRFLWGWWCCGEVRLQYSVESAELPELPLAEQMRHWQICIWAKSIHLSMFDLVEVRRWTCKQVSSSIPLFWKTSWIPSFILQIQRSSRLLLWLCLRN